VCVCVCSINNAINAAGTHVLIDAVCKPLHRRSNGLRLPVQTNNCCFHARAPQNHLDGPDQPRIGGKPGARGPICKISYDLSYDYRKFIVRSTYDSDLKHAEISLGNIVS